MTRTLSRRRITVKTPRGPESVEAWCCDGLALTTAREPDHEATRKAKEDAILRRDRDFDGVVLREGFVLRHEASGRRLTPAGWLMPDFDSGKRLVGLVLDRLNRDGEKPFERAVSAIERFASIVEAAHRKAGALTGLTAGLARIEAAFDEDAYQAKLADLRAVPACDRFREMTGRATAEPVDKRRAA